MRTSLVASIGRQPEQDHGPAPSGRPRPGRPGRRPPAADGQAHDPGRRPPGRTGRGPPAPVLPNRPPAPAEEDGGHVPADQSGGSARPGRRRPCRGSCTWAPSRRTVTRSATRGSSDEGECDTIDDAEPGVAEPADERRSGCRSLPLAQGRRQARSRISTRASAARAPGDARPAELVGHRQVRGRRRTGWIGRPDPISSISAARRRRSPHRTHRSGRGGSDRRATFSATVRFGEQRRLLVDDGHAQRTGPGPASSGRPPGRQSRPCRRRARPPRRRSRSGSTCQAPFSPTTA